MILLFLRFRFAIKLIHPMHWAGTRRSIMSHCAKSGQKHVFWIWNSIYNDYATSPATLTCPMVWATSISTVVWDTPYATMINLGYKISKNHVSNMTKSFRGWITSGVFIVHEQLMCAFSPYIGGFKISYQARPTDIPWVSYSALCVIAL